MPAPRALASLAALLASAAGCAFEPTAAVPAPVPAGTRTQVLIITDFGFFPQRLPVVPGSTVLVRNEDHVSHTITSAPAAGLSEFGAVNGIAFDTPPFEGEIAIAIPTGAPVGTVVPYFCRLHGAVMTNQGELEIVPPP